LQAAQYFCIKLIHIPVIESTRKVNVQAMKRAITSRTCVVSCSDFYPFFLPLSALHRSQGCNNTYRSLSHQYL